MTLPERLANNMITIVIARGAMVATPLVLGLLIWIAGDIKNGFEARIDRNEREVTDISKTIREHDLKLTFADGDRMAIKDTMRIQSAGLNQSLIELTKQLNEMNGNLIRLQTIIDNRLPPKREGN